MVLLINEYNLRMRLEVLRSCVQVIIDNVVEAQILPFSFGGFSN